MKGPEDSGPQQAHDVPAAAQELKASLGSTAR